MPTSLAHPPTAADLLTISDAIARPIVTLFPTYGLGIPGESGTYAEDVGQALDEVVGDGTTTNPGISNQNLAYQIQSYLQSWKDNARADILVNRDLSWLTMLEDTITQGLPEYVESGTTKKWAFTTGTKRVLDMHLCRINANHTDVPAAPSGTPTLTETTGGSIPVGLGRRIKLALVGSADWMESVPGTASAQTAMTAHYNAYTLGGLPAGNVPTGVTKLRIYGQECGADVGDPYYYLKDVTVTEGVAWSTYTTITITEADSQLNKFWQPASYASCLVHPAFAFAVAMSLSTLSRTGTGMTMNSLAMLSPSNVSLEPMTGFYGFNPTSTGQFAQCVNTTKTYGAIRTTNDTTLGLQGYYGAAELYARTTALLNASATITNISITYVDATYPYTPQNTTLTGPYTLNTAVGSTVDLNIGSGKWARSVTAMTVSGMGTGTFVIESAGNRAL